MLSFLKLLSAFEESFPQIKGSDVLLFFLSFFLTVYENSLSNSINSTSTYKSHSIAGIKAYEANPCKNTITGNSTLILHGLKNSICHP